MMVIVTYVVTIRSCEDVRNLSTHGLHE